MVNILPWVLVIEGLWAHIGWLLLVRERTPTVSRQLGSIKGIIPKKRSSITWVLTWCRYLSFMCKNCIFVVCSCVPEPWSDPSSPRADEDLPDKITEAKNFFNHIITPDNATEISMPLICPTIALFPKDSGSQARDSPAKQHSRRH
jgi:hypothetical protein